MKKLLVLLMLLAMGLCIAVPAAGATGPNLLLNPSFEDDDDPTDGIPDNWGVYDGGDGTATYRTGDPEYALEGDDYVEFQVGTSESWPNAWQGVQITAGNTYSIAAWLRTAHIDVGTKPCQLKIEYYDTLIPGDWEENIGEEIATVNVNETGQYEYHTFTHGPAPMAALSAKAVVLPYSLSSASAWSLYADAVHFGTGDPPNPYQPYGPQPCDGCFTHPDTDEISWTNPPPRDPATPNLTCDVLFAAGTTDPNLLEVIVEDTSNTTVVLSGLISPIDLIPETTYIWRVDVNDPDGGTPVLTEGPVWSFDTIDTPPTVEAGKKRAAWLTSPVTVQLDATVTDDGLPDPPAQVSLKWDKLSGPATPSFDDDTAEDPNVTFDTVGEYTLRLTATDANRAPVPGSADPDDTVVVNVYDASYTGLVAHWSFENNLVDSVGGHNGTISGSATYVPGGQVGKAIDLAGGDYVYIGDSGGGDKWCDPNQGIIDEEITLSAWVRHTGADGDDDEKENQAIVSKGESQWQMSRAGWDGNNHFEVEGLSPISDAQGTNDIYDNKWHHLVASYNGEEIALYFDGRLDIPEPLQTSGNINAISYQYQIWIGANSEAVDREWGGLIDEVRIYEIGLPHDKVLELFRAEGGANSCDEPPEYDANGDCYVDLVDLALAANDFMECNDVGGTCQDDPENENY